MLGYEAPPGGNRAAAITQANLAHTECSARQVVAIARGGDAQGQEPTFPVEVSGDPPETPNLYTDGGLTKPTNHHWSCAGFGLWIPHQSTGNEPTQSVHAPRAGSGTSQLDVHIGEGPFDHIGEGPFETQQMSVSHTSSMLGEGAVSHTPSVLGEGAGASQLDVHTVDGHFDTIGEGNVA